MREFDPVIIAQFGQRFLAMMEALAGSKLNPELMDCLLTLAEKAADGSVDQAWVMEEIREVQTLMETLPAQQKRAVPKPGSFRSEMDDLVKSDHLVGGALPKDDPFDDGSSMLELD